MTDSSISIPRREALKSVSLATLCGVSIVGTATGQSDSITSNDSIQHAINNASPGDDIDIQSGRYDEDVIVDIDGLTLRGPNAGRSGAGNRKPEATITGRVALTGTDTALDGFDIAPPPATNTFTAEAVRVSNNASNVTITNNIVRDFNRVDQTGGFYGVDGINIFGGNATKPIDNVLVQGNKVERLLNEIIGGATGISVQGNIKNTTITDNVVTHIGEKVTPYGFGIVIRGTGNHNTVPRNVVVTRNTVSKVRSDPSSSFDGVGFGVEADGSNYIAKENLITCNTVGVELKVAAEETTLESNAIQDNVRCGVINRDAVMLQAVHNWWGHASGPSGPDGRQNPGDKIVGRGDSVEGAVVYEPWLRQPPSHSS